MFSCTTLTKQFTRSVHLMANDRNSYHLLCKIIRRYFHNSIVQSRARRVHTIVFSQTVNTIGGLNSNENENCFFFRPKRVSTSHRLTIIYGRWCSFDVINHNVYLNNIVHRGHIIPRRTHVIYDCSAGNVVAVYPAASYTSSIHSSNNIYVQANRSFTHHRFVQQVIQSSAKQYVSWV